LPDGSSYTFSYDAQYGELTGVGLPTGGATNYGWTNYIDVYNNTNRWINSRTVGSNPPTILTPSIITLCSSGGVGCKEGINVHKPSGDETVYELMINNGAWNTGITSYTGTAASGTPILKTSNVYDFSHACTIGICAGAEYVTKSLETTILFANGLESFVEPNFANPATGQLTSVKEWDYISPASVPPLGTAPSTTPTRETDYTYTGYDVQQTTVLDSNGTPAGQTIYGHTSSATPTTGVAQHGTQNAGGPYLQTVTHWLNTGSPTVTTFTMDDTGEVRSAVDPDQNPPTVYTYQCANSLPNTITSALNQTTTYGYDCPSGAITSVKDPNDTAASRAGTTYAYEPLAGRLQSTTYPDNGVTSYNYLSSVETDTTTLATPDPSMASQSIVDGFGRPSQQIHAGVSSETTYDVNGRASCVTNPHLSSSSTSDGSTCVTNYDGLDRPLIQTQPDGNTLAWSYAGNVTTSTDEAGVRWQRTSDSFGHLKQVLELGTVASPLNLESDYTYDALGNLNNISQSGNVVAGDSQRTRTFTYDSLSRNVCTSSPEITSALCPASATGTMPYGVTQYTYDPNGNLATKTSPAANAAPGSGQLTTTTMTYDAQNRPTLEQAPGIYYVYNYDGLSGLPNLNTIGRLVQATNAVDADEVFSYDAMGRLNWQSSWTPSSPNHTGIIMNAIYDLAGNMTDFTYPDGRHIKQNWNTSGQLNLITYADWNGQPVNYPYASGITYSPLGAMSSMTLGNGATESISYNNRSQPCEIKSSFPAAPGSSTMLGALDHQYFYGSTGGSLCGTASINNGNIASIVDTLNTGRTRAFQYDALNRLGYAARSDGGFNYSYPTDSFGNMQQINNLSYNPPVSFPGSNNQMQLNGTGYTYDARGNQVDTGPLMYGGHHYTFDSLNQLTQLDSGSTAVYTYDAEGNRVRKDTSNGWTEYVNFGGQMVAERHSTGTSSDYIFANSEMIGRDNAAETRIHFSGTNNSSGLFLAYTVPIPSNITIQAGARLVWRQYQGGAAVPKGGVGLVTTAGTWTNWSLTDQDGQIINSDTTQNAWHDRVVDLTPIAGQTLQNMFLVGDGQTGVGSWDEYFADMAIIQPDGTVVSIYNEGSGQTYSVWATNGVTNQAFAMETVSYPFWPAQSTHYYLGDHLGTARMEFAGGGWPVWSEDFAPFGQEISPQATPNNYKFTGLERDAEGNSNLDHAQFRQYSSAMGRWVSPDPYDGSMDISNPQSLNRYTYVGNEPLNGTDPSGLSWASGGAGTAGTVICGPACGAILGDVTQLVENIGKSLGWWEKPKYSGDPSEPRPNGHIWDEDQFPIHYGPNIAGALGLPSSGCEFGACGGGGMGFQQGDWEVDKRPLSFLSFLGQDAWLYHYYFYNRTTHQAVGLGPQKGMGLFCSVPGKWETKESPGGKYLSIPTKSQACVDQRLRHVRRMPAPGYNFWYSMGPERGAANCMGFVESVIEACGAVQ
jgi:RHS repeat-associated protein